MQSKKTKEKLPKQKLSHIINNNWFLIKIAFKEAPLYTFDLLTTGIINRIINFVEHIYLIGFIITSIEYQKPFLPVFQFILIVFVSLVCSQVWSCYLIARVRPKSVEKINKRLRLELYKKASQIDLECYDNPKFYNDFVWAMNDVTDRVPAVIETASDFFGCLVGIILTGGYILTTDKIGIAFLVVGFVGITFFGTLMTKHRFKIETELKPLQRKRDYINRVLYLSEYAKEIRLSKIKTKLYDDFSQTIDSMEKIVKKRSMKLSVFWFMIEYVFKFLLLDGLYIIYLLYKTIVKKAFGFGTMVTLYNSCNYMGRNLIDFARVLPGFQQHSLYIDKIRKFLDYEVKITSGQKKLSIDKEVKTLSLENVSFSYTKESEPVLKNINLTIRKGEKIALVGYNGAGKTTLVKLMMRLYDASSGAIFYDDHNIKDYDVTSYRDGFATVFQDYQLFSATLGQNIVMDNNNINEKQAIAALCESGFQEKYHSFELGLTTPLTKEFEDSGVNLSGGESQKVAISRSLYQDAPIIILDEPSSALDPIAEYNLNNTIRNVQGEKTVIYISHRLSTTKMADRIYMLEQGEIIESGSHEELLALNGKYAEMFRLQAEKYR